MSDRNLVVRFFSAVWSGADAVRKVLHLLLLLFIFLVFLGAISGTAPPALPKSAALVIEPVGSLVEQLEGDPFDRAVSEALGDGTPQTLVQDIVDALEFAKEDNRIELVHLDLSSMTGGGLSKLRRVADAIEDFKESGKKVVASGDFMLQHGYYLAAHANEAYLHPEGVIYLQGYGSYRTYYKDAIDMLRIDWNVFRAGSHKSAFDPYTRMDMSDEDREMRLRLADQLWTLYGQAAAAARGLDDGAVQSFVGNFLDNVRATKGDLAMAAKEHGLVDDLLTRTELRDLMIEYVGGDEDNPDTYSAAGMYEYLSLMRMLSGSTANDENVAVIVAAGRIVDGSHPPGTIGGDSTAALLRKARNDESVKAVVLRVDSGGGSAFASEIIADEVRALQSAGKPVVASMSSVAASGGYAISVYADKIIASPATVTGSIGVLGMFPTFQRTLGAIGVATDGVGTTPWSGEMRPDRELSPYAKELLQLAIEDYYDEFVGDVAAGRGMEEDSVDQIARGQVWTGLDAVENGLVDELGEIDEAIEAAAALAELDDYGLKYIRQELSATEQMIIDLLGASARWGMDLSAWVRQPTGLEKIAADIAGQAETMLRFNDPMGIYKDCLCEVMSN